jgi:hypothetical protein
MDPYEEANSPRLGNRKRSHCEWGGIDAPSSAFMGGKEFRLKLRQVTGSSLRANSQPCKPYVLLGRLTVGGLGSASRSLTEAWLYLQNYPRTKKGIQI